MMLELYHHGVKGQKWGVRNGPPYPIDDKTLIKTDSNIDRNYSKFKEAISNKIKKELKNDNSKRSSL